MKKAQPAHVRKKVMVLERIGSEFPEAKAFWRSSEAGTWRELEARWSISGTRIRLVFRVGGQRQVRWISSVEITRGGIRIVLRDPRRALPEMLDLVWSGEGAESALTQDRLWDIVKLWIAQNLIGGRIHYASRRSDPAHTISGSYLRLILRQGPRSYLLLAAGEGSADLAPAILTQALLWLNLLRKNGRLSSAARIFLLVPSAAGPALRHRARFLNSNRVNVEVWEYSGCDDGIIKYRRSPLPPAPVENRDFRWPVLGPFRWSPLLARVLDLAPQSIRRYPRFQDYDTLRLFGLEFARVMGAQRDHITYGIAGQQVELTEGNFEDLRALVDEILFYRRPDCPDMRHPFYSIQAERWMESLILDSVEHLFPELVPESVYSQIPVYLGSDAGRVDILGADREGSLVVMELKVAEDPNLPLQALDYWGRVIGHNQNGDFERRGYFCGIKLSRAQPKIYLISPVFSFHDSSETLLASLDPTLEVWKVAVNEDWRCGVKILRRMRIQCGSLPDSSTGRASH